MIAAARILAGLCLFGCPLGMIAAAGGGQPGWFFTLWLGGSTVGGLLGNYISE